MIVWMVAMPIAILLLALAGANWKFFHLAYAKHLIRSDDREKRYRGLQMVFRTHLREGMALEEVRAILAPARVTQRNLPSLDDGPPIPSLRVYVEGASYLEALLGFDEDDKLQDISLFVENMYIEVLPRR